MPPAADPRAMTDAPVTVERNDLVTVISLDCAGQRNTLTADLADALCEAVERVTETDARAVLLRGEGETFCAGGDLSAHVQCVEGDLSVTEWADRQDRTAQAIAAVAACPLPTVAAIDGPAFSEGACLALACDIRIGSPDAAVGFGFRRFGQAAAGGATYLLPRVVGRDVAAELLYTGTLLDAEAAEQRGLLTRVVPNEQFDEEVASLLTQLGTGPTRALKETKRLLDLPQSSLAETIEAEEESQRELAETAGFSEGVTAFVQQREPDFGSE